MTRSFEKLHSLSLRSGKFRLQLKEVGKKCQLQTGSFSNAVTLDFKAQVGKYLPYTAKIWHEEIHHTSFNVIRSREQLKKM